jgi:hypothetical protein
MALTALQVEKTKLKVGATSYSAFIGLYSEETVEHLLEEYKNNYNLVGAAILEALADQAAGVKEVKIGPITVKLDAATFLARAKSLRKAASPTIATSYAVKSIGTP